MKLIPYIGCIRNSTRSHSTKEEYVLSRYKRKIEESNKKQCTQVEALNQNKQQPIQSLSVSFFEEEESSQSNPSNNHTCTYGNARKRRRRK